MRTVVQRQVFLSGFELKAPAQIVYRYIQFLSGVGVCALSAEGPFHFHYMPGGFLCESVGTILSQRLKFGVFLQLKCAESGSYKRRILVKQ